MAFGLQNVLNLVGVGSVGSTFTTVGAQGAGVPGAETIGPGRLSAPLRLELGFGFGTMVQAMKQMAAEMHQELESTRSELRRGVLEMPQEAADNTAQMRKVIVDQIEALAELNRIVAHHGRGLDVVTAGRPGAQRQEESIAMTATGGRNEVRMRDNGGNSASTLGSTRPHHVVRRASLARCGRSAGCRR